MSILEKIKGALTMGQKGQLGVVNAMVAVAIGLVIFGAVLTIGTSVSVQTYDQVDDDITALTNTTVQDSANAAVEAGFNTLENGGNYGPVFVGIVVLGLFITAVGAFALGRGGGGSSF